jgi:adenylate cyclase
MGVGAMALAALGEIERTKDWMDRALLIDPDNTAIRWQFACALATSLNDPDAAVNMLGPALERDNGALLQGLATDPDLAGLRGHPRLTAMAAAAKARLAAAPPAEEAGT